MFIKTILLAAFCASVLLLPGCASNHSHDSEWDYTAVNATDPLKTQKVNQLASEGWQLVATDPYKGYLFKRARSK